MNKQSYWYENAELLFEATCGLIENINQDADQFKPNTHIIAKPELLLANKSSKELTLWLINEINRGILGEGIPEGMVQFVRDKLAPDLKAYIPTSEVIRIWDIAFNRKSLEKLRYLDTIVDEPWEFYLWEDLLECLGDTPIRQTA